MERKNIVRQVFAGVIVFAMVFSGFLVGNTLETKAQQGGSNTVNTLRLYGEDWTYDAAFPYTTPDGPFNPLSPEAPQKDFVVFNPALVDISGIVVNGEDAKEKVFVRQWFIPVYREPVGKVWLPDPNIYYSEDVITEYTFMFIDKQYNATCATPRDPLTGSLWTTFWFPVCDNSDEQIGIDGADVDGDGYDDLVTLQRVGDFNGDGFKDIVISTDNFELQKGDVIKFLDFMIEVVNARVISGSGISMIVNIYYLGNDEPELIKRNYVATILPGDYVRVGRHTVSTGIPIPIKEPWYIKAIATGGGQAYVQVGRILCTGETFFVDGAEYDIAAIYGPTPNCVKYITIRNPVPEHEDVNLEDLSVIKKAVNENEILPLLPPFNRVHKMIDDINIPNCADNRCPKYYPDNIGAMDDRAVCGEVDRLHNNYDTIEERIVENVDPLEIYFVKKDEEPRFDTNLMEILDESIFIEPTPIDVVLAIDSSGSMAWNDPNDERLNASKYFVDLLDPSRDRVGVVSWDNGIDFAIPLTNNFSYVKSMIDTIDSDGGTNLDVGLDASIDLLDASTRLDSVKVIVFLSNGQGSYTPYGNGGPIDEAASKNYLVYAIGLISNASYLKDMATCTGGGYYENVTPDDLQDIYKEIFSKIMMVEEGWKWLDIHTMPDFHKEFVYPALPDKDGGYGDFLLVSSWRAPNSCETRVMFVYDQEVGLKDIYINDYDAYNTLRLYGEDWTYDAASPYTTPDGPFDPLSPEAPQKDFVTFNPALYVGETLEPGSDGIVVDNQDAKEKVFARQWFIPVYKEPLGMVWLSEPQRNISEDIITEYTYMFVDKHYKPMCGHAGLTKFWLPICDNNDAQIGIDGADIDGDGYDDRVLLQGVGDFNGDGFKDIDISSETFELKNGEEIQFLDYKIKIVSALVVAGNAPGVPSISIVVDIYYLGNDEPERIAQNFTAQIVPPGYVSVGRHIADASPPIPVFRPWYIKAIAADNESAYVQVGRILCTNESFFVDGAEYYIAAIYGPDEDCVKYITIRNPVPEHEDVNLEDLSVIKKAVNENEILPLLPPFNRVHKMIDDIDIPDSFDTRCPTYHDGEVRPIADRIIDDVPALDIRFIEKNIEERYDTSLLEILKESEHEAWVWLDIHTMPDFYKEFVYPELPDVRGSKGDWLVTLSFTAPNSCNTRVMFAYDASDGTGLYMNGGRTSPSSPPSPPSPPPCKGDFDGDGDIDFDDFVEFAGAYDSHCGDPNYTVIGDFDDDGDIDFDDFVYFAGVYGYGGER
ncbi:MAG: VWA domain-containing protein [Thermoplasmata archaeon]|nr:VWA domain-containing protein [Thermoplasmata archaeon]